MTGAPPNFFRPERLDGEGFKTYQHRRRVSKAAAHMGRLLRGHKATQAKLMRRALVNAIGIRQAKKWLRNAKAARRAQEVVERLQDSSLTMEPVYSGPAADRASRAVTNMAIPS